MGKVEQIEKWNRRVGETEWNCEPVLRMQINFSLEKLKAFNLRSRWFNFY
jgi:hypothetical protein